VVVDHGVQEAGADQRLSVLALGSAGPGSSGCAVPKAQFAPDVAPAASVGDLAKLLDVHVEQFAGPLVLITADRLTSGTVDVTEPVDPTPDQDRVDRRGRDTEPLADLDRTQTLLPSQVHDLAHHRGWGAVGLPARPRRTVHHAHRTLDLVAVSPLLSRLPRHVVTLGGPWDRPSLLDNQPSKSKPSAWRQGSVGMGSVRHEDLLVGVVP